MMVKFVSDNVPVTVTISLGGGLDYHVIEFPKGVEVDPCAEAGTTGATAKGKQILKMVRRHPRLREV